jgi:hypothetical protein
MAGVYYYGEMRFFHDEERRRKIQSVSAVIAKGSNASLAKYYLAVSLMKDVFSRHKPFFHGGGHASLEQNWFFGSSSSTKKREILHISSADLDYIAVFFHDVEKFMIESF